MRVALTGASGYVGSRIADRLRTHGHEVLSLSRRACPEPWHSYALGDDPSQLPWTGVDALIHAACDFTPRNWNETLDRNVKPGLALFDAAKAAGVGRLLFISSMSAFNGCRSRYGRAKLEIEKHALSLGAAVIRPGLVWGHQTGGVMGTLETLVAKSPIIPTLSGPGKLPQYLVHEKDLSSLVSHVASEESFPAGAVLSVMHPDPLGLSEILTIIARRENLTRHYLPVHWRLAMIALKSAETLGIHLPFRSDSLVGLVHGNPDPEIITPLTGVRYRPFE
jgi:nucleoside-diphosphate-sugar epimerase